MHLLVFNLTVSINVFRSERYSPVTRLYHTRSRGSRYEEKALELSKESYVLADRSKIGEIAFSEIADISKASIITNDIDEETQDLYKEKQSLR